MSELSKFKDQREKLANVCNENGMTYRLKTESYPITLTIRPESGMDAQITMLEAAGDIDRIPEDAYIKIAYTEDGIKTVTDGGFPISKALRSKIENIFEKLVRFYNQWFHRTVIESNLLQASTLSKLLDVGSDDPQKVAVLEDDLEEPDELASLPDDLSDIPDFEEDLEG